MRNWTELLQATEKNIRLKKVRYQQEMVILKLAGIDDRNGAEAMKNKDVFITEDDLEELPCDTFYIKRPDRYGCNRCGKRGRNWDA